MIFSSPPTCVWFRIVVDHFFVISKADRFKTGSGVDGISKSVGNADTVYGKITYVLDDADGIKVPEDFPIEANAPYTGHGFTGSKNIVLPELVQDTRPFVDGDILSIYDAETGALAIAPGTDQRPYSVFEVVEPINVKSGSIASWFDEPGGGIQYLLPDTVDELLDAGILRRIQ